MCHAHFGGGTQGLMPSADNAQSGTDQIKFACLYCGAEREPAPTNQKGFGAPISYRIFAALPWSSKAASA